MNNTNDDKLKELQDLNTQIKEFNVLLVDAIASLKADKLTSLKDLNAQIKEFNTLLLDLNDSLKKDAVSHELHQTAE